MKVTMTGTAANTMAVTNSTAKKGTTPRNILPGSTRSALAVAKTFMPMGGVMPAISPTKTITMTRT